MDLGDRVHVTACRRESVGGGGFDVFEGERLVPHRFEIEAEIETGVELGVGLKACRAEDLFRTQRAAEHLVDLAHRNASVGAHWEQAAPGFLRRFGPSNAEEMPRGVLNVVRIHGAVGFKLGPAVFVAAGVIERDPALPELWRNFGGELDQVVEPGGRLDNAPTLKIRDRAVENVLRTLSMRLRCRGEGKRDAYELNYNRHARFSLSRVAAATGGTADWSLQNQSNPARSPW